MNQLRLLLHSGLVVVTLCAGSGTLWILQSRRFLQMVEQAVVIRFNILNPEHWLQILLWVN